MTLDRSEGELKQRFLCALEKKKYTHGVWEGDYLRFILQFRPDEGFGVAVPIQPGEFAGILIQQVAVHDDHQGQGIFTEFMDWLVSTLKREQHRYGMRLVMIRAVRNLRFFCHLLKYEGAFVSEYNINDVCILLDQELIDTAATLNYKKHIDLDSLSNGQLQNLPQNAHFWPEPQA